MTSIWPYIVLILLGCGWGLTIPLTIIAVTTGLGHLGIIFWQFFIVMVLFGLRQIFLKNQLSLARSSLQIFCVIAFIGTIFPNSASLIAASYLPGGVLSILIATVPMFAFPIALFLALGTCLWTCPEVDDNRGVICRSDQHSNLPGGLRHGNK